MASFSNNRNITAANATVIIVVDDLFPAGFKLEQFSTDLMVSASDDTYAETRMGVDLQMVAGYIDTIKTVGITLEASSPSVTYMDMLIKASRSNKKVYWLTMIVNIPALNKTFIYSNGVLKAGKLMSDVKRVLDPISYQFDFEKIS